MDDPRDAAARLVDLARSRPPTLGSGRLICIDGPAGSGKTTLAAAVSAQDPDARVVHLDDLYDGWDGLPRLTEQLGTLLEPLAQEQSGHYRRYDWDAGRFAERVDVAPGPLLVLEGVGSGATTYSHLGTALAWVEAPADVRLRRGLARDGESVRARWLQWQADEAELFARERTRDRADLRVDTTS